MGTDTGLTLGPTLLLGLDYDIGENFRLQLFYEGMSPTAGEVINDLFHDGITYDASCEGCGNHILGASRIGLGVYIH